MTVGPSVGLLKLDTHAYHMDRNDKSLIYVICPVMTTTFTIKDFCYINNAYKSSLMSDSLTYSCYRMQSGDMSVFFIKY